MLYGSNVIMCIKTPFGNCNMVSKSKVLPYYMILGFEKELDDIQKFNKIQ